jgi:hypothetical protein
MLGQLLPHAQGRNLGRLMLAEDPLSRHVPVELMPVLVDAALAEGRDRAEWAAHLCGEGPDALAAILGVPVVSADDDANFGSHIVFAQYIARPARITLYRSALAWIDRILAVPEVDALLAIESCTPAFLAHELYHHLDHTLPCGALSRRHRVCLIALGRWHWRAALASLDEIAAGAFAQALLGLTFHPRLLELLAVVAAAPHKAGDLAQALRRERAVESAEEAAA